MAADDFGEWETPTIWAEAISESNKIIEILTNNWYIDLVAERIILADQNLDPDVIATKRRILEAQISRARRDRAGPRCSNLIIQLVTRYQLRSVSRDYPDMVIPAGLTASDRIKARQRIAARKLVDQLMFWHNMENTRDRQLGLLHPWSEYTQQAYENVINEFREAHETALFGGTMYCGKCINCKATFQ